MLKENFENTDLLNSLTYENYQTQNKRSAIDAQSSVICGSGKAFPATKYTQREVSDLLGIENKTVQKLLEASHIRTRHLYLPDPPAGQKAIREETHEELNQKFDEGVMDIGLRAANRALADSPFHKSEIDFLVCVTSSGFRVPGVSSMIARGMGLKQDLYRLDVVGMGCNAGMSALRTASALARAGQTGILLCCEINSAIYVRDESVRTGIVNSLFGDGASAVVVSSQNNYVSARGGVIDSNDTAVEVLGFSSFTLPEQWGAMRFDWNLEHKKWSFGLSKQIPFVVGENLKHPVEAVLCEAGISKSEIRHWSIHTGGAAVIDGAKLSLGISEFDVRHTRAVMKEYGNISSGSFLVSHQRLLEEGVIADGDYGILAAMGPGATLEAALVKYHR